jgi:hypothetical protein
MHTLVFRDQERGFKNSGRRNETVCRVAREEGGQLCGFHSNSWSDREQIDAR